MDHFLEDSSEFSNIVNDSSESFGNASGSLKDIDSIKSSYNNKNITNDFLEKVVDGLKVLYTNADSVLNKIDEITVIAHSDDIDIVIMTEPLPK